MGALGTILGFLTALATIAIEWMRQNPNKNETVTEESLSKRQRHLEAKHKFAEALGRGDSREIKKQLDAVINELHNMRQLREADKINNASR